MTLEVKLATAADVDLTGEISLRFFTVESGGVTPFCCAEHIVPLQTATTANVIEMATVVGVLLYFLAPPRMGLSFDSICGRARHRHVPQKLECLFWVNC